MRMVRPVGERFTANYNSMSEPLSDEIRDAKLPRIHVKIALFKSNPQRYTRAPRGEQCQKTAPGEVRFHYIRTQFREQRPQLVGSRQKMPLAKVRTEIKDVDRNAKIANLPAEFSIPKQTNHLVINPGIFNRFPQHGDQVSLGSPGSKFVDHMDVKHGSYREIWARSSE